jgi:hypothetical protein
MKFSDGKVHGYITPTIANDYEAVKNGEAKGIYYQWYHSYTSVNFKLDGDFHFKLHRAMGNVEGENEEVFFWNTSRYRGFWVKCNKVTKEEFLAQVAQQKQSAIGG